MLKRNRAILDGAIAVAQQANTRAVLLVADLPEEAANLEAALGPGVQVIPVARGGMNHASKAIVTLPDVRIHRKGAAKIALLKSLELGLLDVEQRLGARAPRARRHPRDHGIRDRAAVAASRCTCACSEFQWKSACRPSSKRSRAASDEAVKGSMRSNSPPDRRFQLSSERYS
jgi:hypothetical protein